MANKKFDGELVVTKVGDKWEKSWSSTRVRDTNAYTEKCRENAGTKAVKVVKRKYS